MIHFSQITRIRPIKSRVAMKISFKKAFEMIVITKFVSQTGDKYRTYNSLLKTKLEWKECVFADTQLIFFELWHFLKLYAALVNVKELYISRCTIRCEYYFAMRHKDDTYYVKHYIHSNMCGFISVCMCFYT